MPRRPLTSGALAGYRRGRGASVGNFEHDTDVDGAEGRYRAELSRDWEIWGPNGGYLAAIALRAAGREAEIPRPATFSAHFLAVAEFGPVDIEVVALRRGRRSESMRVTVRQGERAILEALVRTAAEGPGLEHTFGAPPRVDDPEDRETYDELRDPSWPRYRFWDNLDARVLEPERFRSDRVARDPVWQEWYRFRPQAKFDDPFVDAGRSLLLIDTMSWPAASSPHPDSQFQAPNLDVAVWFHASAPESEWLLCEHVSPVAQGGLMGTVGRVWSRDRRLLASGGAQLLCVPTRFS